MSSEITDFVMAQPLFDSHDHLAPMRDAAASMSTPKGFSVYAFADLVTALGARSAHDADPFDDSPEGIDLFFDTWAKARNTAYCWSLEHACQELWGLGFTRENWPAMLEKIRAIGQDPEPWYTDTLCNKANVKWVIKDSINTPEAAADGLYPDCVRFNYRDCFLLSLRKRADVIEREQRWGRSVHSLDDLMDGFNQSITDCLATGKVTCFKIGLAYKRALDFANPTRHDAEQGFNKIMSLRQGETHDATEYGHLESRVGWDEARPLQDWLTHQYIRRATDEGLPIQVHTGYLAGNWNELGNVNPVDFIPTLRQYPTTRFDIFHASWPHHDMLAAMGAHYPNVWVNMCWAWSMNTAAMEYALDSFLDAVPYTKIFGFGADTITPFTVYAYAQQARGGIARVLERRIERGVMDLEFARTAARAIMLENAEAFHGLSDA